MPPENPPTPAEYSATGKPLNAGFWLGKNLSDCFRSGGRGRGLGGRGLGHPCESPLGNLATVRVAHPGLVLGCQIWVPKKTHFLELVPDGLVVEGLGIGQGGVWAGAYKGFACLGKGVSHILLLTGKFWRGIPDQTVWNLARTRKSQKWSQRSQEDPRPSQKILKICLGPGPSGPFLGPRWPCGGYHGINS